MRDWTVFSAHLNDSGKVTSSDSFVCQPCPTSICHCAKSLSCASSTLSHMFWVWWSIFMDCQRVDRCMHALTIWAHDPLTMMGRICWKYPPKTTDRPPNGLSEPLTSWKVWWIASWMCQCCIGASSHMIGSANLMSAARKESLLNWHIEVSWMLIGNLKHEWEVWPPMIRRAAIPEDATQMMILCWQRRK